MRLIDADALREHMYHEAFETDSGLQKWESGLWIRYRMFEDILNTEITVDAEPVRHGHWVDDGQRFGNDNECAIYECDQCGETIWVYLKDHRRWNYCPQCGSKMSEEVYIKLKRKDEVTE